MSSIAEKLTYDNWEGLASLIAQEFFPVGTLVDWHYAGGVHFGLVTSVSDAGKITVQKGSLPLEKVTDNEGTGGTYAKFWYNADLDSFTPFTEEGVKYSSKTLKMRFRPRCYRGDDWMERGYASPIEWVQIKGNRMLILSKPDVTGEGFILEESYGR